jgi:diadenosine tetraphosphate (Ap4A) HIT family hydrolase
VPECDTLPVLRDSSPFERTSVICDELVPMNIERWPNEDEMVAELYGGAWADPEDWAKRCRPDGCVICTSGRPYGIVGGLAHTWVTTDPEVAVFGYVCVISKSHAVEPFDLPTTDQATFWREAMAVARALSERLRPIKMNYEIHGNTLPHLHMHLLPRQPDDAFVGRPIDLKEFHHRYTESDLEMLKAAVRSAAFDEA